MHSTFWTQSEVVAASNLPEAEAYTVRARYNLARCCELTGEADVGRAWKDSANTAHIGYMKRKGRTLEEPKDAVEFYNHEVAWMLW